MTVDKSSTDYLSLLASSSSNDRLKSARFFLKNLDKSTAVALEEALKKEKVLHVRSALQLALKQKTLRSIPERYSEDSSKELNEALKSKAVEHFSGIVLHELEPKIGALNLAARNEIGNYDTSDVKKHLDTMRRTLDGIRDLRKASKAAKSVEFDLSKVVSDIKEVEIGEKDISIYLVGFSPFLIKSDEGLLSLAISNGIRNAVEAIESLKEASERKIVIEWGKTDVDVWLRVLDSGIGIRNGYSEIAFEPGKTNKKGHVGFGLTIVRQAISNINGKASLLPAGNGGAILELRWSAEQ